MYYICHYYDTFQKDQIEHTMTSNIEATVFTRSNKMSDIVASILPTKYGKYHSKFKIDKVNTPSNVSVYLSPVNYLPFNYSYEHMGERHYRSVKKVIKKHDLPIPELVHSHHLWSAGYVGKRLKEEYDVPFVVTGHGYDVYDLPFRSDAWNKRICQVLNSADHIITVSNTNLACIQKLNIETPVSVIPNGFDASQFHPINQIECREKLCLPVDKKILLTVGNCVAIKGQKYLIEAMKDIHAKYPNVLCVIVGGGELYADLQKLIGELGLQNCVMLVGRRPHEEIPLWMNACDVFVLPSLNEGNPTVLVECLGCGKPFIGTRVGGIPEMISSHEYGLVCEPKDVQGLFRCLVDALDRKWDTKAILDYAAQYSWNNICRDIISVYTQYL